MNVQNAQAFSGVTNGKIATLQIPKYALSLAGILLTVSGASAAAHGAVPAGTAYTPVDNIRSIQILKGARVVWGPMSGAELAKINAFKGQPDAAGTLLIDFLQRDSLTTDGMQAGAIDIPALGTDDLFLQVENSAVEGDAGTIGLSAKLLFTPLHFDPVASQKNGGVPQLMTKYKRFIPPASGGTTVDWNPQLKGARVLRAYVFYTGSDFSGATNGNLHAVTVKKNGSDLWGNVSCYEARILAQRQKRVPQSKTYVVDFALTNVIEWSLNTQDAQALEWQFLMNVPDSLTVILEFLQDPNA